VPYLPRLVDAELQDALKSAGFVLIEGPKACGKTETARRAAASEVLLDIDQNARAAIEIDPDLVLAGDAPRLIDEWQLKPVLWNHIKRKVSDSQQKGRFILTGSSVPADDATRDSAAGRVSRLRMRPMSLYETGHSSGAISLNKLLDGDVSSVPNPGLAFATLVDRIAIGGWPSLVTEDLQAALRANRAYLDEIRRIDVGRVDGVHRDPERVGRVLASLARNVATYVLPTKLGAEAAGTDGAIKTETVQEYLSALERLMILEAQPPWSTHLRSRSRLKGLPKRLFVDPSLAVAALRTDPQRLLSDLNYLGFLFESLVIRDLRIYSQPIDGRVFQYRDNTGLEVDAIVELGRGRWGAFEVKLGSGMADAGAANLLKFAARIDTRKCGDPAVLGVIVGTGYGYRRDDGVAVIPVGALGP
jgi:predicted AAA+ superfamily ATPase